MATDFGEDASKGQSSLDYSMGITGIVGRTLTTWTKKLIPYIIMIGGILAMFTIVEIVVGYFVLGELWTAGLPSDFQSYFTQLVYWILYPTEVSEGFWTLMMVSTVFLCISLIVTAAVIGATVKYTLDAITEGNEDIGESMSFSFSRFIPMLITILILNLLFGLLLAPGAAMTIRAYEIMDLTDLTSLVGFEELMTGALLTFGLGIPIMYIAVRMAPVFVVIIAEDVSATEALSRAFEMTRGNFMRILIGWILIFIFNFVLDLMIDLVLAIFLGFGPISSIIYVLVGLVLKSPILYIFFTILYKDLESRGGISQQEYW